VRNSRRRELALLVVFLAIAAWHAYGAARVQFGRMQRFEITPGELETWAKEMDASVRFVPAKADTRAGTARTTASGHWQFDAPEAEVYAIVNNWEHRIREKIGRNGWRSTGSESGGDSGMRYFRFYFRNKDSYYETYLYASYEKGRFALTAIMDPEIARRRVRLRADWFAVGYSRMRSDRHDFDTLPSQVVERKPTAVDAGGSGP
jgi:hypothetical protein